jgi:hypothetical protein
MEIFSNSHKIYSWPITRIMVNFILQREFWYKQGKGIAFWMMMMLDS